MRLHDASQAPHPASQHVRPSGVELARSHAALAPPRYAVWELTRPCNDSVPQGASHGTPGGWDGLSTRESLALIAELSELGVREVTLTGGEAYLRGDWLELIAAIRARGMDCGMISGGRGMSPVRAKGAAQAGLQTVSITLDGLESTHERVCGTGGTYRDALSALSNLREAGVAVAVHTQLQHDSIPELDALLEVVIAHGAHSWHVQLGASNADDAVPPLLDPLHARCDEAGVRLWASRDVLAPRAARLRGALSLGLVRSLAIDSCILGIEADGAVTGYAAHLRTDNASGNVREATLHDLWQRILSAS